MIKRSVALLLMAVVLATGVYLLIAGLHLDKQTLPSALIGKALPEKLLQLSPLILSARPRPRPHQADDGRYRTGSRLAAVCLGELVPDMHR
ncbi:MAG: hypothetical protein K0U66_11035 [Gammaproteobacteria bacterium]|nr:hypothetical protein [Gammaproteobacteria bacterium]